MARGPRKGQTVFGCFAVGEQAYLRPEPFWLSFSPCGNAESTAQGIVFLLDTVFTIRE